MDCPRVPNRSAVYSGRMSFRVAADIGGTFTDLAYLDESTGEVGFTKVPTTPGGLEQAVLQTIHRAGLRGDQISQFVHGTTVVINAITERKGARTGLITTYGMRDVLEIARGNRPDIYNLRYRKPPPFVPRDLRLEIWERLTAGGQTVTELDDGDVREAAAVLRRKGAEAVAVCFLHSYANPEHERRAGVILRGEMGGAFISLSHEITREYREYERTSTTVLNSYVGPTTERYLSTLVNSLKDTGIAPKPYVMHSNGGMSTVERTKRVPINLVESGPAGGVIGAAALGKELGLQRLITLDVGGTTAKTSLVSGGAVTVTTEYSLERSRRWAGYPIKASVIDILEIGAGGGSIAWVDEDGALRVGPRSAGADPGPAAYAKPGGTEPTVTDANLIAGRLNPGYFLGGTMTLDAGRARNAYSPLAECVAVSVDEAAQGVLLIANSNMMNAIKIISVQRGHDPRDFTLVAMGGGGPIHAAYLARELRIGTVIIPVAPGHFSAFGMLTTDLRRDFVRTSILRTDRIDPQTIETGFTELEEQARTEYAEDIAEPVAIRFVRAVDMRYRGQEHTVRVPAPDGYVDSESLRALEGRFHDEHERSFAFRLTSAIEVVNLHLVAMVAVEKPLRAELPAAPSPPAPVEVRSVWFEHEGHLDTPIFRRPDLPPGAIMQGPAIVEEVASATIVYPNMRLCVQKYGELLIQTGA